MIPRWRDSDDAWEKIVPTHYISAKAKGGGDGSIERPWTIKEAQENAVAGNVIVSIPDQPEAGTT